MKKHFVTFMSPGTFVAEQSTQEIESWDVDEAVRRAKKITERYGAKPYGFHFTTRELKPGDFDSKQTHQSGTYFLNGEVRTVEQVRADAKPDERILLSNMECNKWDRVVTTKSPYRWTQPLEKDDHVLTAEDIKRTTRGKSKAATA